MEAPSASSPYAAAALKYAAALLAHGRDYYGPVHTPLFVQMIDLRTLEIPKQRTAAEWRAEMAGWKEDRNYLMWGKDRSSVLWAQDSNLLWDTENVRLMYALSRDTGVASYATAADDYIRYFLKHCVSRTTGFFAWGEHIAYNVVDDEIHGQRHELQHPSPLWPELWKFDPDTVRNEIEAIYLYHITDKRSMAYDRHANYWNGLPERDQATIMGYAGIYIDAFAFMFEKTGEVKYTEWARKLLLAFQSKSNAVGLYPDNWTDRQKREMPLQYPARPGLATALYTAFERTRDSRWLDDANRYLEACKNSYRVDKSGGENPVFGDGAVGFGEAALRGYELTGKQSYLEWAKLAGREVMRAEQPHAQMASTLANAMNGLRRLYEVTGEQPWLDGARRLGDYALAHFVHSSGLILGTAIVDRPPYYDAIQGSGALALALYRLGMGQETNLPAAAAPARQKTLPPMNLNSTIEISEVKFPGFAMNAGPKIPVTARISAAVGIERATLHYTYGNEVGFQDSKPLVHDGLYTFFIQPPGMSFLGEILFALEAVEADPRGNREMTTWHKLRVAAMAGAPVENRTLRFPELGAEISECNVGGSANAFVSASLPEGISAPPPGWVSTGHYFWLNRDDITAGTLTLSYAPENAERLIEQTLTLACWDGKEWQRIPSKLDRDARKVSGPFQSARYWTLLGEDRVLWRAPGRQGGTALADLDGDGKYEVVADLWQPGELLSPSGKSVRQFPIDSPTHPVLNASPPIVAKLAPERQPLLLLSGPAGYVYAYDREGKLHWRTEVGGEIQGGVAVGKLTDDSSLSVAACWDGGAAAIDSSGSKMWQREVPAPSGSTPVLADLDGDGKLEVVINAGSGILALEGDTGTVLWEYSVPGTQFVAPAIGEFTRNGRPRIVTADQRETVHVLNEEGSPLWRQDQLYGPFEVPEWIDQYAQACEVGLADLEGRGERQIVVSMKSGDTVALSAGGERLWHFVSHERKVGTSLTRGGHLAFADLDNDGKLEVIVSQQDSYLYVLDTQGRSKWTYRGYFWYHSSPTVADLENTGELNTVFACPEENGLYALRSGFKGIRGRAPWPFDRGNLARTNCAPWEVL